jgi:hypothetical protein
MKLASIRCPLKDIKKILNFKTNKIKIKGERKWHNVNI